MPPEERTDAAEPNREQRRKRKKKKRKKKRKAPDNGVEVALDPTRLVVGEFTIALRPPQDLSMRWDIVGYQGINTGRAAAAALGACWRGKGRPKASLVGVQYSVGAYGGAVTNELLARGVEWADIMEAGALALGVLQVGLVKGAEVAAKERHFQDEAGQP